MQSIDDELLLGVGPTPGPAPMVRPSEALGGPASSAGPTLPVGWWRFVLVASEDGHGRDAASWVQSGQALMGAGVEKAGEETTERGA